MDILALLLGLSRRGDYSVAQPTAGSTPSSDNSRHATQAAEQPDWCHPVLTGGCNSSVQLQLQHLLVLTDVVEEGPRCKFFCCATTWI